MKRGRLHQRQQGFELCVRRLQAGIEFRLIVRVQSLQVHLFGGLVQCGQLRRVAGSERRNQQRRRQKLQAQVLGIGPALRKFNPQRRPLEGLCVHRVQQLHSYRHLVAGLGLIEQHNRLQIVTHRHPPPVEVENLRHRPVRRGVELKPDSRPRQVVAPQGLRHLKRLTKPHRIVGSLAPLGYRLPSALVQAHGLSVRQIPGMHLPGPVGQLVQP